MDKETPVSTGALVALGYIAVTLPFLEADFLGRGFYAGPGFCYLLVTGLIFGRTGAWGCLAGCLAEVLFRDYGLRESAFLLAAAACLTTGPHILWYLGKNARQVALHNPGDFVKYLLISLAASGCAGTISGICFKSPGQMAETAAFTFFWCVAAGIPVIILMLPILGIQVRCPAFARTPDDLDLRILGGMEEIGTVNDKIEELCGDRGLDIRTTYRLMSCLEELLISIMESGGASTEVRVRIRIRETIILSVVCCGPPYNPLKRNGRELMEDQIGLKLIRQMSLRASYRRVGRENQIKVVM